MTNSMMANTMVTLMVVMNNTATIAIGIRKGRLVLKQLEKTVEQHSKHRTEKWSDPVDPVIAVKAFGGDVRTKRACWVQGSTSVEHAYSCQQCIVDIDPWHLPASSAMKRARPIPMGAR